MLETSPDNGNKAARSPFTSVQGAADAASNALHGAQLLAEFWIEQGVCFTSGHVVSALRQARGKSLMVNQRPVGATLQGLFTSGEMPGYEEGRPFRKLRRTQRTDTRTPVGTEVYVYGPSEEEIDAFEFEINIEEAPQVDDGLGGYTSAATALLNATPNTAPGTPGASPIPAVTPSGTVAVAYGKMVSGTPLAAVHSDGRDRRLNIPRVALEALAFETGEPVRGGEPLYLVFHGGELAIYQTPQGSDCEVKPTTDRLRLHLNVPNLGPIGTEYEIVVNNDCLSITL